MPDNIKSQDPVTRSSIPARTYGDMKVSMLKVVDTSDGVRLALLLTNYDAASGEEDPESQTHRITSRDFASDLAASPKLNKAWDDFINSLAMVYKFKRLDQKWQAAVKNDTDTAKMKQDRDAALADLKAAVQ